MYTKMQASSSEVDGGGRANGPSVRRSSVRRLKVIGYLALLCAVVPAAAYIATGHAGVPVPFSAMCGVVSCAAADHAL